MHDNVDDRAVRDTAERGRHRISSSGARSRGCPRSNPVLNPTRSRGNGQAPAWCRRGVPCADLRERAREVPKNRKASPHAEHRDRCSLPGLAGLAGQRWRDHKLMAEAVRIHYDRAERAGFEPAVPSRVHTISSRAPSTTRSPLPASRRTSRHTRYQIRVASTGPAESVGFEPTVPLRAHLISNQAPSTTRPALRGGN